MKPAFSLLLVLFGLVFIGLAITSINYNNHLTRESHHETVKVLQIELLSPTTFNCLIETSSGDRKMITVYAKDSQIPIAGEKWFVETFDSVGRYENKIKFIEKIK